MRLFTLSSVFALCASASAFSDTSPFIFLSTAEIPHPSPQDQLQTSSRVSSLVESLLSTCPTLHYVLVSQPDVNAADLSTADGCAIPGLCLTMSPQAVRTQVTVSEVFGSFPTSDVTDYIRKSCVDKAEVKEIVLPALSSSSSDSDRSRTLLDNGRLLRESLESIESSAASYTIIYFSGPAEATYEAEFQKPLHMDLKRQVRASPFVKDDESDSPDSPDSPDRRNLFAKYQFFTPGIFMGLLVGLFLISILSVGIKALGSLEVSYGAFEKDMTLASQKKQHH